ncbi:MAG: transglutaminase-like domain-containing protein [Planctomycetota bacterium]
MNPSEPTPLHCHPRAFEALAEEIDGIDTTRGLVRCAVAVSMHELGDADPDAVEGEIVTLATSIRDRVNTDQLQALLAHAHAVLFDEARFAGNTDDYYHPDNSYLPRVLETRQGLPITLVLIYKAVLETLGVRVLGVNAPGHFLAGVRDSTPAPTPGNAAPGGTTADDSYLDQAGVNKPNAPLLLIDPFHGGKMLNREEAFTRIEEIAGGSVVRDDALLRPATHTEWLIRLIQNLVTAFDKQNRRDDMSAMLELRALVESVR